MLGASALTIAGSAAAIPHPIALAFTNDASIARRLMDSLIITSPRDIFS
jgi:hypothetical protein